VIDQFAGEGRSRRPIAVRDRSEWIGVERDPHMGRAEVVAADGCASAGHSFTREGHRPPIAAGTSTENRAPTRQACRAAPCSASYGLFGTDLRSARRGESTPSRNDLPSDRGGG